MRAIRYLTNAKKVSVLASFFCFVLPAFSSQIPFEHVVTDKDAIGHREVGDIDGDGHIDVITCEHKGPKGKFRLQIFENNGKGNFTEHIADRGKESHLGARVADMDNDGDLDIVSVAWDNYQLLHLWRNDSRKGDEK